ncbi:MAG TPA: hypothetical protein VMD98_10455 [Bryocella sp.]|nr:hypothetical protein [Bryocella sp.]
MLLPQAKHQPDLLLRAVIAAECNRLAPEIQKTVVYLLKQLLNECLSGVVKTESPNE